MIFLNSTNSAAALVFYLPLSGPSMKSSVHTERGQSPEYILKFCGKNTIFNEHPVHEKMQGWINGKLYGNTQRGMEGEESY